MKITLKEGQNPRENENYVEGLQFEVIDDNVFVQIGHLSIRVKKEELGKVLSIFS